MRPSDSLIFVGQRCGHPSRMTYLVDGCLFVRRAARASERAVVGDGLPAPRDAGFFAKRDQDLPGYWASLFLRAMAFDPARRRHLLAHRSAMAMRPSGMQIPWATGSAFSGLSHPRPTRSRAYASTMPLPSSPQGSLPTCRARRWSGGLVPAGRLTEFPEFLLPFRPAVPGRTCILRHGGGMNAARPSRMWFDVVRTAVTLDLVTLDHIDHSFPLRGSSRRQLSVPARLPPVPASPEFRKRRRQIFRNRQPQPEAPYSRAQERRRVHAASLP